MFNPALHSLAADPFGSHLEETGAKIRRQLEDAREAMAATREKLKEEAGVAFAVLVANGFRSYIRTLREWVDVHTAGAALVAAGLLPEAAAVVFKTARDQLADTRRVAVESGILAADDPAVTGQ